VLLESAGWAFVTNLQLVFIFFDNWIHLPFKFLFPQLLLSCKIRFTAFVLKIWIIRMWLESNSRYLCHLQELAEMIFQSALSENNLKMAHIDRWLEPPTPRFFFFLSFFLLSNHLHRKIIRNRVLPNNRCSELNLILKLDSVSCKFNPELLFMSFICDIMKSRGKLWKIIKINQKLSKYQVKLFKPIKNL
jgi:hypothetical protein